jgi:hypothetical protein
MVSGHYVAGKGYVTDDGKVYPTTNPDFVPQGETQTTSSLEDIKQKAYNETMNKIIAEKVAKGELVQVSPALYNKVMADQGSIERAAPGESVYLKPIPRPTQAPKTTPTPQVTAQPQEVKAPAWDRPYSETDIAGGLVYGAGRSVVGLVNFFSPINLDTGKAQIPVITPAVETIRSIPQIPAYASKYPAEFLGGIAGMILMGQGVKALREPKINVARIEAETTVRPLPEGATSEFTTASARLISKSATKTREFAIEGRDISMTKPLTDELYMRYGKSGSQVFEGEKVVANIKGTYGGLGKTADELSVERGASVMIQEGKSPEVFEVGTIAKKVSEGKTKILSRDVSYGKGIDLSKPGKPNSVTFGVSEELYSIGDETTYKFDGAGISGPKGIKMVEQGYKDFKTDLIVKPGRRGIIEETGGGGAVSELLTEQKINPPSQTGTFAILQSSKSAVKELTTPRNNTPELISIGLNKEFNQITPSKTLNVPKEAQKTSLFPAKSIYSETMAYDVTQFYPQFGLTAQKSRSTTKQKTDIGNLGMFKGLTEAKQGLGSLGGLKSLNFQSLMNPPKARTNVISGLGLIQGQKTEQIQLLGLKQLTQQKQQQRQTQRTGLMSMFSFGFRTPNMLKIKNPSTKKKKGKLKGLFDVLVRESRPKGKRKIKEYKVGSGLPRFKAINLGAHYTDITSSRTFRLVPKGKGYAPDVGLSGEALYKFRGRKGKSKLNPTSFVEKSAYAIDTSGERKGITIKGLLAKRKKNNWRL